MASTGRATMMTAQERANEIARSSYGKLVAIISSKIGDITAAEDFIAHAFQRALEKWPEDGIPPNPEGWIITTAKNKFLDEQKSAATRYRAPETDAMSVLSITDDLDTDQITDKRLALMFACAHPAVNEKIHTPLILQAILGLDAVHIATAFAVQSTAMAQRLVRAKRKIKLARIPFAIPNRSDMPDRLDAVLEAIYGAYAIGVNLGDDPQQDLADEALYLSDLVVRAMPDSAESLGLAALLSYSVGCANISMDFIPLSDRDTLSWDKALLDRGDKLLMRAKSMGEIGRFQLEAAIFSVHADRRKTGETDHKSIVALYQGLLAICPTLGSQVAMAAAVGHAHGTQSGLNILEGIETEDVAHFQPFWVVKASLYHDMGDESETQKAVSKAISITTNIKHRKYLETKFGLES